MFLGPERLAISAISTQRWSAWEDLTHYRACGIHGVGLWRDKLHGIDLSAYRVALDASDLVVTNLCFAGQFTLGVERAIEDGERALEQAAILGAPTLLIISGRTTDEGVMKARGLVMEGLGRLAELSAQYRVTLALEALHPMDMTTWTIIPTIGMALDIIDELDHPSLGLMLDLYNAWWDPELERSIKRAASRIVSVQVADWRNPTRSFTDRAIPGTGVAGLAQAIKWVEQTGYRGFYDLEIFSDELWSNVEGYSAMIEKTAQWWQGVN